MQQTSKPYAAGGHPPATPYSRQLMTFMSLCVARLPTLRCTNTCPGPSPSSSLAGTRESEHPILQHRQQAGKQPPYRRPEGDEARRVHRCGLSPRLGRAWEQPLPAAPTTATLASGHPPGWWKSRGCPQPWTAPMPCNMMGWRPVRRDGPGEPGRWRQQGAPPAAASGAAASLSPPAKPHPGTSACRERCSAPIAGQNRLQAGLGLAARGAQLAVTHIGFCWRVWAT